MPFTSDEIAERFGQALASGRLSHAYLLHGADRSRLQAAGERLAALALKAEPPLARHPDFYLVQPESKSRRIRIEQIRDLGKALALKAYAGGPKVALLCEVERMCLGGADAANAFLKTLEEPQPGTLLILTSAEPQIVLPTILSRCVRLHLRDEGEEGAASQAEGPFLEQWFALEAPAPLRAYARATLFGQRCQQLRADIEEAADEAASKSGVEEDDEEAAKAILEGEFLLARRRLIASIEEAVWRRAPEQAADRATQRSLRALEELNSSLLQNVEQSLAIERAMLAYEGLIDR
jgi:DNA polymerase-3 subunit delta'